MNDKKRLNSYEDLPLVRLCGGQAGNGNTVGRAADVVQANVVAELDTAGIAAVLAADEIGRAHV